MHLETLVVLLHFILVECISAEHLTWIYGRQPSGVSDGRSQWCSSSWPWRSSCLQNKHLYALRKPGHSHHCIFARLSAMLKCYLQERCLRYTKVIKPSTNTTNFFCEFTCIFSSNYHTHMHHFEYKDGVLLWKHVIWWLTLSLALLGVPTLATGGLLKVVGLGPTTTAQGVRLVPALTERWCSLRLRGKKLEGSGTIPKDFTTVHSSDSLVSAQKNESQEVICSDICVWRHHWQDSWALKLILTWCKLWGMQYYWSVSVLARLLQYSVIKAPKGRI